MGSHMENIPLKPTPNPSATVCSGALQQVFGWYRSQLQAYQSPKWHTIVGCESQTVQGYWLYMGRLRPEEKKDGPCASLTGELMAPPG